MVSMQVRDEHRVEREQTMVIELHLVLRPLTTIYHHTEASDGDELGTAMPSESGRSRPRAKYREGEQCLLRECVNA